MAISLSLSLSFPTFNTKMLWEDFMLMIHVECILIDPSTSKKKVTSVSFHVLLVATLETSLQNKMIL